MTAADQPTTEPSAVVVDPNPTRETEAAHAALCDADEARRTDMVERMAQAAYSHPEGTPWGMSNPATKQYFREQQGRVYDAVLAPAPQPAADTEVQWGVRDLSGGLELLPSKVVAEDFRRIYGGTLVSIREEA